MGSGMLTLLGSPERPQYPGQPGARRLQFLEVYLRKRLQFPLTLCRQLQQNAPAVIAIRDPCQQSELRYAINQLDGGVVPNEQQIRQLADRNRSSAGKTLNGEKRLVLLGRHPGPMGGGLAERQEFSQLIAKLGENFVIDGVG